MVMQDLEQSKNIVLFLTKLLLNCKVAFDHHHYHRHDQRQ